MPVGLRRSLASHEVRTFEQLDWDFQLENGKLLDAGEAAGFDVLITSDQNIKYQQNLAGRRLALVVLGSNIWPIVRGHASVITASVEAAVPGSYAFVEMPLPPRNREQAR